MTYESFRHTTKEEAVLLKPEGEGVRVGRLTILLVVNFRNRSEHFAWLYDLFRPARLFDDTFIISAQITRWLC